MFRKKVIMKNFLKLTETPIPKSYFKVTGLLHPVTFLKKTLRHSCYPVKFPNFLDHLFCRISPGDILEEYRKINPDQAHVHLYRNQSIDL